MKSIFKVLAILMVYGMLLFNFSTSTVFASSKNYELKIVIDHNFKGDEDDEISCVLEYDDTEKEYSYEEDDFDDKIEITRSFDDPEIKFDCDEDLDEIKLYVYDENDKQIGKETYEDEDKFEYEVNEVDEDEQWFEIKIDHDFGSDIDCDLKVDGDKYDYTFDEDSDNADLTIKKNFDEDIEFSCEDELDEISFKVYDDDGDELYDKDYSDKKGFDYNIDDEERTREFRIEIDHDFDDKDPITCELSIDGDDEEKYEFDEDSSSSDLKVVGDFDEELEFDCDDDFDEISLRIYDENGNKVEDVVYDDEDKFDYEFKRGDYEATIQIFHSFSSSDEKLKCDLYVDSEETKGDYDLTKASSLNDFYITESFNKQIEFKCNSAFDKAVLNVYEYDDSDSIFEKEIKSSTSIKYVFGEKEVEEVLEPVVEEVVEEPIVEVVSTPEPEKVDITESNLNVGNDNLNVIGEAEDNSQNISIIGEALNENSEEDLVVQTNTQSDLLKNIIYTFLAIIVVSVIAVLILLKMGVLEVDHESIGENSKRNKKAKVKDKVRNEDIYKTKRYE